VRASRAIKRWLDQSRLAFDELVFPWECQVCGEAALGSPFCEACRRLLLEAASAPACERCAMPLGPWADRRGGCSECRGRSLGFDAAIALGPYEGPIRDLCIRLKRERNAWLAPWLADLLVEARPGLATVSEGAWVAPVPLHWRRQWTRGYNQADALARRLARRLSLRLVQPLRRAVATAKLAHVGRVERAEQMRGAFQTRRLVSLQGRTVLLVDDILTTGATCGAAARALKRQGAAKVVAVVIGRAQGTLLR
jgi:ComF family protein